MICGLGDPFAAPVPSTVTYQAVGGVTDTLASAANAVTAVGQTNVIAPAGIGLVVGLGGQVAGLTGKARNITGFAALGAIAWAAWNAYQNFKAGSKSADVEASEARERESRPGTALVGAPAAATAVKVAQAPTQATDAQKREILTAYACYEHARRAMKVENPWWNPLAWFREPTLDKLKDCGLTSEQLQSITAGFNAISKADRVRLMPGTFGPGGSLEDLGR